MVDRQYVDTDHAILGRCVPVRGLYLPLHFICVNAFIYQGLHNHTNVFLLLY